LEALYEAKSDASRNRLCQSGKSLTFRYICILCVTVLQKKEANPKTPPVTLDADSNNDKMERMNGEVRDRDEVLMSVLS
jgi:hypothetical protein